MKILIKVKNTRGFIIDICFMKKGKMGNNEKFYFKCTFN